MADEWNSDEEFVPPGATSAPVPAPSYRADYRDRNPKRHQPTQSLTFTNTNWRRNERPSSDGNSMEVPSRLVGRVVGKGGSKIRELESDSGARIQIVKGQENSDTTTINFTGSQEAINKARSLIENLLEDNPHRGPRRPTGEQRPQRSNFGDSQPKHYDEQSNYNQESSYKCEDNANSGNRPYNTDNYKYESSYNNAHSSNGTYNSDFYKTSEPAPQEEQQEEPEMDWHERFELQRIEREAYWNSLTPIYKKFYVEDPEIAGMSAKDVARWRLENNNISVERVQCDQGETLSPIPNPVHTFEQAFSAYPEVLDEIYKQNFVNPSPIQSQAWPVLLSGDDLIGIAQTGTGKTLAFLLPALIHIDKQPTPLHERNGPNVLILAPTRELAIQIDKEVKKYQYKDYKSVCIYGGASRKEQINVVAKGVQIVIATPGRLNDLVRAKHINIEAVTYLVLDEADRMLDMGFGPQIRVSLLEIRPTRQTVMTSATWPSGVQRLAELYTKNPVRVIVGSLDLAAVHTVEQSLLFVNDDTEEKFEILLDFFSSLQEDDKVIVFCSRKATTISIASDLAIKGINFTSIYGGLEQCDREQAIEDMKDGTARILVATDVASRGIDIENITHIVNFDFPTNLEEFVHRVGRTGRAGKTGKAITYISRRDWDKAEGLISILQEAGQYVPQELVLMAERYKKKMATVEPFGRGGRGGKKFGPNRYNY